jgi:hypothetical protein
MRWFRNCSVLSGNNLDKLCGQHPMKWMHDPQLPSTISDIRVRIATERPLLGKEPQAMLEDFDRWLFP